jgi:hypothetical protein
MIFIFNLRHCQNYVAFPVNNKNKYLSISSIYIYTVLVKLRYEIQCNYIEYDMVLPQLFVAFFEIIFRQGVLFYMFFVLLYWELPEIKGVR